MKRLAMFMLLAGVSFVFVTQGLCQDHWYWFVDPGNERLYFNVENPNDQVSADVDGEDLGGTVWRLTHTIDTVVQSVRVTAISLDPDGSVWFLGWGEPLVMPDTQLLWVDAPLEVGNAWDQWITWTSDDGSSSLLHHVSEVIGEEEITLSYYGGTYHCKILSQDIFLENGDLWQSNIAWYNDGMGSIKYYVYNIAPWGGTGTYEFVDGVVPVENQTWGAVKSLFR